MENAINRNDLDLLIAIRDLAQKEKLLPIKYIELRPSYAVAGKDAFLNVILDKGYGCPQGEAEYKQLSDVVMFLKTSVKNNVFYSMPSPLTSDEVELDKQGKLGFKPLPKRLEVFMEELAQKVKKGALRDVTLIGVGDTVNLYQKHAVINVMVKPKFVPMEKAKYFKTPTSLLRKSFVSKKMEFYSLMFENEVKKEKKEWEVKKRLAVSDMER